MRQPSHPLEPATAAPQLPVASLGGSRSRTKSLPLPLPLVLFFLNEQKNGGRGRRHLKREGTSQASLCSSPAIAWVDLSGWVSIGHSPGELHTGNLVQGPALPVELRSSHRSRLEFRLSEARLSSPGLLNTSPRPNLLFAATGKPNSNVNTCRVSGRVGCLVTW